MTGSRSPCRSTAAASSTRTAPGCGSFEKMTPEQRERWVKLRPVALPGRAQDADPVRQRHQRLRLSAGQLPEELPPGEGPRPVRHGATCRTAIRRAGRRWRSACSSISTCKGQAAARTSREPRGRRDVRCKFDAEVPVTAAALHYTTDTGPWQMRKWKTQAATIDGTPLTAEVAAGRPLVYFLTLTDDRKATVSTEHEEVARE